MSFDMVTNSEPEIAIQLNGISKAYHMYSKPEDRLKQMLFGHWKTYYRDFWALTDIDLTIRKGEAVGLVGRNGAGKSTLLQVITSILQPSSGLVTVTGRIAPLLQLGTSFNPEFTGLENIDLSANILGLSDSEIAEVRSAIVGFAELGEFINQPVRTYSSGMFARLAFAIAAHVQADILIVDEVLSVGDIGFTQKCTRFLREFRERGTLVFVSHDVGAVLSLCDRAVWLDSGRIIEDSEPKRVIPHYSAWIANSDRGGALDFVKRVREKFKYDEADSEHTATAEGSGASEKSEPAAIKNRAPEIVKPIGQPETRVNFGGFDWNNREFGVKEGIITNAWLENANSVKTSLAVGGEELRFCIECKAIRGLDDVIVGMAVVDRLGVIIFAWDTSKEASLAGTCVSAGEMFIAKFSFNFPHLAGGTYSTVFALANGTGIANKQQHWLYNAMELHISASNMVQGTIGVPMNSVQFISLKGS